MPYTPTFLIRGLADWLAGPEAARPVPAWSTDPLLSNCQSPAGAAAGAVGDPAVFAALAARDTDPVATLAALAVVAGRLQPIVRRWCRSGLAGQDLADAEADLVTEALAAMRADPSRPPAVIAQMAWHRVEAIRRTLRSRAARQDPLAPAHDRLVPPAEPSVRPLGLIGEALAAGVLTAATAAVVWAECNPPVIDREVCDPVAWRQRRSRARRALRAALGPAGGL